MSIAYVKEAKFRSDCGFFIKYVSLDLHMGLSRFYNRMVDLMHAKDQHYTDCSFDNLNPLNSDGSTT